MKNNRITKVKVNNRPYSTMRATIHCTMEINKVPCTIHLSPLGSCISQGADSNEVMVDRKTLKISSSSYNKTYFLNIGRSEFVTNPKQKDFQFTGPIYLVPELQKTILYKMEKLLTDKSTLTQEFIEAFKII